MSEVNNNFLLKEIMDSFAEFVNAAEEPNGMLTIELNKGQIVPLLLFLKDHNTLQMQFLTDVCGIHHPEQKGKEFGVIYHVHSFIHNLRLRIKCFMPIEDLKIDSVAHLFGSANWQERETYDFYGIEFQGHPNLKRILNVDEMDYFPMRKEYPLEDQTRTDKDDTYFGR